MNLAPLLYNIFARRHHLPALRSEPVYRATEEHRTYPVKEHFQLPSNDVLEQVAEELGPLLEPRGFAESVRGGRAGVAVFDPRELDSFLRRIPDGEIGQAARWWEFLPLNDGTYALFPNDTSRRLGFEVLLPVRVRPSAYQLRRASTGLTVDAEAGLRQGPATVDTDLCQHLADRRDDELPYEGTCEGPGCAAGCTADVVVRAEDGAYILVGCDCEEEGA